MGRKNYRTKQARRTHSVEYVIPDMRSDYEVTMQRGGHMAVLVVTGTSVSCWTHAIREGRDENSEWYGYHPVAINAINEGKPIFSVI